jgi:hypothetical protein
MCLRFVFLVITRVITWLRLSRREETWKTAEILLLRHQLTVLRRHQACRPKLTWADRALLATLLGVIPKARRQRLQLLITPQTIVRWRRDIPARDTAFALRRDHLLVEILAAWEPSPDDDGTAHRAWPEALSGQLAPSRCPAATPTCSDPPSPAAPCSPTATMRPGSAT